VLGKAVSFVEAAIFPAHKELALAQAVPNPTEAHVNSFGALLFETLVGNTSGSAVVSLDWVGGCG
jgi:membrane protein YqaA with SNARE-associated domain